MAFIQVGIIAKRDPSGYFHPAVPICKEVEISQRELTRQKEQANKELASFFADKFKVYMDGCRAAKKV